MKVLMLGDIYAKPGRQIVHQELKNIVLNNDIDFVVVNGENATHGKSISKNSFDEIKSWGVDVITSGNHIFKNKEVLDYIDDNPTLLRPMNMYSYLPGKGYVIVKKNNKKFCIVNLIGTSFMDKADSPYEAMDEFLKQDLDYDYLLIDFHAEATAEKLAFAWNYDGKINALVGTHTHVQTADERILPKGSAYISDLGMCGATNTIIGADPKAVIYKEKTGLPSRFEPGDSKEKQVCGVIIELDDKTNKTKNIERVFVKTTLIEGEN